MAVNVATGDYVSVIWSGLFEGQQTMHTLCYKVLSIAGGPETLQNFLQAFREALDAPGGISEAYTACLNPSMININLSVQVIWPVRYHKRTELSAFPTGTWPETTGKFPPNVAAVYTLQAELSGRAYVSTKHIGAQSFEGIDAGFITDENLSRLSALAGLESQRITISDAGVTIVVAPVIYHRADPSASGEIITFDVQDTSRTERRRTVGLGS